jgi:acetyl-CoA acetyltransferase
VAELAASFTTHEHILTTELGLGGATRINPSGGALAGHTMMAAGLVRIAEAAGRIHDGSADRALGHASSGLYLQQNLVCVMEGD